MYDLSSPLLEPTYLPAYLPYLPYLPNLGTLCSYFQARETNNNPLFSVKKMFTTSKQASKQG